MFELLLLSASILFSGKTVIAQRDEPCAVVASMSAAFAADFPQATGAFVPARAAAECLQSVPLDVEENKALIDELGLYLDWQSNLAYLANPPKGYTEKRVDTAAELKKIYDALDSGEYEDEYTLQRDIRLAFDRSFDFHLNWNPDILNVFTFFRGDIGESFALVSMSSDGNELPELYNYFDVIAAAVEGRNPSPITSINNRTAGEYLRDFTANIPFHEEHARYNKALFNQASASMGSAFITSFDQNWLYDGDYTYVEYANGTTQELLNIASVPADAFNLVDDGESFFQQFCNLGPPQSQSEFKRDLGLQPLNKPGSRWRDEHLRKKEEATRVKRQGSEPSPLGYPTPQVVHEELVLGGYYLSGRGYEDVAVLSIPNFGPNDHEQFQNLAGEFLQTASAEGKKKLVIDLRDNGGGSLFLGYDLFKQLFPSMEPYGATRFRATESFDLAGQFFNSFIEESDITYERALRSFRQSGLEASLAVIYHSMFNYRVPLSADNNENFTSWEDFFGPHTFNNDRFTSVARWDLNNFFSDDLALDVTGYSSRKGDLNTNQPFKSEDIVMLMDGGCGSTCAVFAEFAKIQGGVQTITIGGKPETGPMQGVSGSKGSEVLTFNQVRNQALVVYENLPRFQERLNDTDIGRIVYATRPLMRTAWSSSGTLSRINLRDHIRMNDDSETPLEFVYEAADCRLWYTPEMVLDVEAVWRRTVDAQWGDKGLCVEGSTEHKSSLSGGQKTAAEMDGWKPGQNGAAARLDGRFGAAVAVALATVAAVMLGS